MTQIVDGGRTGGEIKDELTTCVDKLTKASGTLGLATVLMSDDGASETYVSMKQKACDKIGIDGYHYENDPAESIDVLFDKIDELNENQSVHGILVQLPVPDHVDEKAALRRINPLKDVDGFHPENVGRLVAGDPRFNPCTPFGVQQLLAAADVDPEGKDVV